MKKLLTLFAIVTIGLMFSSCEDSVLDPIGGDTGKIFVTSNPTGAAISIDGVSSGKVTPDTVSATAGSRSVKLTLAGYADTTFSVTVVKNSTINTGTIVLRPLTGAAFIQSTPVGAEIWVDGVNTGKVTPDTIKSLTAGNHTFTLRQDTYYDTTFTVNVAANGVTTKSVVLTSSVVTYTVRIWETVGTTASQPSGLDLSTGQALSTSGSDKQKVDIYYSSTGFLIQSAHLNTSQGLTRVTKFRVGTGTNLTDGVNSPDQSSGTWSNSIGDRENNYVFLYDHDGHYSKLKIVGFGGGTPGNPAYVDLQYIYNKVSGDKRF